ncbi:hypothetical protein NM208_g15882 [Fusarium decemcellulare]|uniref:Uncharacterized protein n=1 Tax=Fusarium decemcellulare TaxID=57161 RepID=A0ACC1RBV7_9HYPO|nr:hypothetical protein NM208_g15882 [Fusarium decemcellulare]
MGWPTHKEELVWGDCAEDPAQLSQSDREKLNISARLPKSIKEALGALMQDGELCDQLGSVLVRRYFDVKKAETDMLEQMGDEERSRWITERY